MQKIIVNKSEFIKITFKFLLIAAFCIMTFILLLLFASFFISKADISFNILFIVTAAILAFSAAFCGFVMSKLAKENGLFWGVLAGIILALFFIISAIHYNSFAVTSKMLIKALATISFGAIGGIIGVNTN